MGGTDETLKGGQKGKARLFLLPVCLVSQAEAASVPHPGTQDDSSFGQLALAPGLLALLPQPRDLWGASGLPVTLLTLSSPVRPIPYIKCLLL